MTSAPDSAAHDDTGRTDPAIHEEPEITQEEAVPNDGRDVEGERLMKEVENKKLEQPPGQERQG